MGSQHVVWQSLYTLQMKDAADACNYVGRHCVLCKRLLHMGAVYTDAEAVFQLLCGLPHSGSWPQFKTLITLTLPTHTPVVSTTTSSLSIPPSASASATVGSTFSLPSASAFNACVAHISAEAARILNEHTLAGGRPGSEYVNAVTASSSVTIVCINDIAALCNYSHTPHGTFCTTVGC